MSLAIPNRFLFKLEFPLHHCKSAPKINGTLDGWSEAWKLPALHSLDGEEGFADLYAAWNEDGLYIGVRVTGKRRPLQCDPEKFWKSDNVRVMTDMRDTRNIRRATRFCQQFWFLPAGGGRDGRKAAAGADKIHRATDDAPLAKSADLDVASDVDRTGYTLTAHLSAAALNGFDPVENPRIGLLIMVEDTELGQQSITVGDDLNWHIDPSTWPTAVLMR